ncbi:MAG: triose-phosphate isomerase [Candidatus Eisenbacteria bacterium]|nr:triose-phosphate isomerase [Candidatus Eisenbacteria bacterium]
MRTKLIAGNWKMHLLREEALALIDGLVSGARGIPPDRRLLVVPPYTLLFPVRERLRGSAIDLGAQDLHWETSGAHTSAISGPMLKDAGCSHVLVGHSERRKEFGDCGLTLWKKVRAALAAGLVPVYCVGESLEEREAGRTRAVLEAHFHEALPGLSREEMGKVILAYEPVWAIGTGRTATPAIAQEAHASLRELVAGAFGAQIADSVLILYGGSVKPENARSLLSEKDVDGLLVGGASLTAEGFLGIACA